MSARPINYLILCLAALLATANCSRSGEKQPLISLPDSYAELYRQILAHVPADKKNKPHDAVAVSEASVRLWLAMKDDGYRRRAVDGFRGLLADPQFKLDDFHALQGFGRLAVLLRKSGLIRAEDEERLRQIASVQLQSFCKSLDNSDNNIRLAQVLGNACLLKSADGLPEKIREEAAGRLEKYWALIREAGDLDEDAANYDSLGLVFLVDLVRLMGWEEELRKSAHFQRQFERCREIVSPAGLVPEYGDAYFSYDSCPLDRIYLLEYAARLYDDPTFLDAARRIYRRPQAALPALDIWYRALPLINLERSMATPKKSSDPASLVTYRARRDIEQPLVDKLILRTGRNPGAGMVMLDLYANGSHSHPEKGPSIAYFEVDQVPLFHNLGRHRTRSAITGNLFWALPGNEQFPGCWNRENTWFTMTIPVDYLNHQDERFLIAPAMSLRNFQEHNRKCQYLYLDNLRLEGKAGPAATKLLRP